MNQQEIIRIVEEYVKRQCENVSSDHDWWHIKRVYNNAMLINQAEKADEFVVTLIALGNIKRIKNLS